MSSKIQIQHVKPLLTSSIRELQLLSVRGHLEVEDSSGPDVEHLRSCMRVLDAMLLDAVGGRLCEKLLVSQRDAWAFGLVRLCTTALRMLAEEVAVTVGTSIFRLRVFEYSESSAHDLVDTALRVLVNLTNGNIGWSNALLDAGVLPILANLIVRGHQARKTFVVSQDSQETAASSREGDPLDRLCLALAVLTNIVQESDRTTEEWQNTRGSAVVAHTFL